MPGQTHWCDFFGLESAHDYDPVWAEFVRLGYAITVHVGIGATPLGWYHWTSNFVANHVGSFAWATHPACKALVLGGVTRRFPDAVIAFQECGVSWAVTLLSDLIEHWEKRNLATMRELFDPDLLDLDTLTELFRANAPELAGGANGSLRDDLRASMLWGRPPEQLDEFAAMDVHSPTGIVDLFAPRLWFGCEPDDRTVTGGFAAGNGLRTDFNVMLGSDIGHFDTPVMADVVPSVLRMRDDGLLTGEQVRAFLHDNAHRLFTANNPDFFRGTSITAEARHG
jgi:hypothetical protein